MDSGQELEFLYLLKTLADENRLKLLRWLTEKERNVSEMAEMLKLSEPTVSHHISKMHNAGLLHLRMAGNQRFYRLNEKGLARFKAYVAEMEAPLTEYAEKKSNNAWIDTLDWGEEDKKVLRDYTDDGRITKFPVKEKKWLVILRWLATQFEANIHYTEKQVNEILTEFHEDYATLRRNLVEYGFMRRERAGSNYWLAPEEG